MKKTILCMTMLLAGRAAAAAVGFAEWTLDAGGERPLPVAVWYPAASAHDATPTLQADDAIFVGQPVLPGADMPPGRRPLLLLSHGFGGNWRELSWLAHALASQGYMVAATNHLGTSSDSLSHPHAPAIWRRAQDLSRLLDGVLAKPAFAARIDAERIAAAGHSLGGWAVMLIGGARFDPQQFDDDCRQHGELLACRGYAALGAGSSAAERAQLGKTWRDARIRAVASLDLGLSRGLSTASLRAMPAPVLVIAAGAPNPELPAALESADLARRLRDRAVYLELPSASHFSFLQRCKPGAAAVLRQGPPAEHPLCDDGPGSDRAAIHQQVATRLDAFLRRALAMKTPPASDE